MNPGRRSLIGLGIAGLPLALLSPNLAKGAQLSQHPVDPLLEYLANETKQNCRLARRLGRERGNALRRLGANLEVVGAYMYSRDDVAVLRRTIGRRVRNEGIDSVALALQQAWPAFAATVARTYDVNPPEQLDYTWITKAIDRFQRYGFPRFGGVRSCFEREADRAEMADGRAGAIALIRQTPGSDYGPPGWAVGSGDGSMSCYELGILIAFMGIGAFIPDMGFTFGLTAATLTALYAIACG